MLLVINMQSLSFSIIRQSPKHHKLNMNSKFGILEIKNDTITNKQATQNFFEVILYFQQENSLEFRTIFFI